MPSTAAPLPEERVRNPPTEKRRAMDQAHEHPVETDRLRIGPPVAVLPGRGSHDEYEMANQARVPGGVP